MLCLQKESPVLEEKLSFIRSSSAVSQSDNKLLDLFIYLFILSLNFKRERKKTERVTVYRLERSKK